jgi:hypothetical protein
MNTSTKQAFKVWLSNFPLSYHPLDQDRLANYLWESIKNREPFIYDSEIFIDKINEIYPENNFSDKNLEELYELYSHSFEWFEKGYKFNS